jgi:tetratricopeptide (TPR) repeat protein
VPAALELLQGWLAAGRSSVTTEAEPTSPTRNHAIREGVVGDGYRLPLFNLPESDNSKWLPMLEWTLSELPNDHHLQPQVLYVIGLIYLTDCAEGSTQQNLEKALTYLQQAALIEPGNPEYRVNLALALAMRSSRTDSIADADLAIIELETAIGSTNEWPGRVKALNILAGVYSWRHFHTGSADDRQKSSEIMGQLHDSTPESPNKAVISGRESQFKTFGIEELAIGARFDTAIGTTEHALSSVPSDGHTYEKLLETLSRQYAHRYDQTGHSRDLDLAISRAELCHSRILENSPSILGAAFGMELACRLLLRWSRHRCYSDITTAFDLMSKAADAAMPGSSFQLSCLVQRAAWLPTRPDGADQVRVLRDSIEEIESIRTQHNDRIGPGFKRGIFKILSAQYSRLYDCTKELTDLDKAIESMESSLDLAEETSQEKYSNLGFLGNLWIKKASLTRDKAAHRRGIQFLGQCCLSDQALPSQRVRAANVLVHSANHAGNWDQSCLIAESTFPLMSLISSRDLRHDDKIHNLRSISGLASGACAAFLSLGYPSDALEKVELGRGLLIGDLIDIKNNLSDLTREHPDLAQEYDRLRDEALGSIESNDGECGEQHLMNSRRAIFQRMQHCENRIREKAGFESFLRPLRAPEMAEISREGPIIIVNATCVTAHALILTPSKIGNIKLENMSSHAIPQFRQQLARCALEPGTRDLESDLPPEANDEELLSWLWYTCVKPILESLSSRGDISISGEKSRVWWMGVGAATGLPFHAAGDYSNGAIDENENCLDRVISSYTPTIKVLRNARERATRTVCQPREKHSLLVATMPDTPGYGALPGVRHEAQTILSTVKQDMNVKELNSPSTDDVLAQLQNYELVHFACHGYSDPGDPDHSHLLLQKDSDSGPVVDKLTVKKLLDSQSMSGAWIAYLSACSTAEIRDTCLQEEALHITSGFLIAGFSHVIGSLWPADDDVCVDMAAYFYEALITRRITATDQNRAVAEAVHDATLRIRRRYLHSPLSWALYTHMGA